MEVIIGKEGLDKSWQKPFPEQTKCLRCRGFARIGFVAFEGIYPEGVKIPNPEEPPNLFVHDLHSNQGKGELWLHDFCAVAVYFCRECLETTALYNQV